MRGGLSMQHIELSLDPFYSESNIRYLEGMMDDIKSGKAKFLQHDLIEHIEDEYDKKIFDEYEDDKRQGKLKIYSHEEVWKELGL